MSIAETPAPVWRRLPGAADEPGFAAAAGASAPAAGLRGSRATAEPGRTAAGHAKSTRQSITHRKSWLIGQVKVQRQGRTRLVPRSVVKQRFAARRRSAAVPRAGSPPARRARRGGGPRGRRAMPGTISVLWFVRTRSAISRLGSVRVVLQQARWRRPAARATSVGRRSSATHSRAIGRLCRRISRVRA